MAVVLLSSTGVQLSQHWCGDQLVNATFFGEATPCDHFAKNDETQCPMHAKKSKNKKCCDQRSAIIDGNNYDYEFQEVDIQFPSRKLTDIDRVCIVERTTQIASSTGKFLNHSPPLLASETAVLLQTFLI